MDQSLSITLVLEGGLPSAYLSVQDNYSSPAQIFIVPMDFIDIGLLIASAQTTGDYWMVTASPDNPRFQVESAVFVKHRDGKILWDIVYEHYEPFLNIELEEDPEEYEENIITFSFDTFQYVSALYQASQVGQHLAPTIFSLADSSTENNKNPLQALASYAPRLNMLWQKYGQTNDMIKNGRPTHQHDIFALEAEKQWLQDLLDTLDEAQHEDAFENLDAYLESLPEEIQTQLEGDSQPLKELLDQRWRVLVNSLTEEESEALENHETASRFPNSLKLRLMREFLEGNPSVLLGTGHKTPASDTKDTTDSGKVVDLQHWKRKRTPE
ncbi:MAG: hypothetical protein E6Q85_01615 [Thiothrix sp.]|nr:MAG: hypothetical protein E6Q85_01615 [Thiothrix sp.]